MATVFICLVLITLVANAVIAKSKTKWWRDPGSLFRTEIEPAPVPDTAPARGHAQARQPWEVAPRQEVAPRHEFAAQPGGQAVAPSAARGGRHAMRSNPAAPIEHAETEIIDRIPSGRARY